MSKPFTFDRVVRMLIALAITIAVIWLTGLLYNVLLPFCLACLLSYIMEPFVEFNQRLLRMKKRGLAVFITIFDCTIVIGAILYFLIPPIINEIHSMGEMIKQFSGKSINLSFLPDNVAIFVKSKLDFSQLIKQISENKILLARSEDIISVSLEYLIHALEWLLTFIYIIFIILDYDKMGEGFRLLVPQKYKASVFQIASDIKESMNRYFRSQLLIATCAAVFYCIGFSIVGIPMAVVMGILVGILYMIPYFQYVTLIPIIAICFINSMDGHVEFWKQLCECGLVYVVSQCICDYVLTPKIMGKSLGLNPAIILLSLSIWGTLLGIIGMIIALPLTTLCLAYYKKVIIEHRPLSDPTPITQ